MGKLLSMTLILMVCSAQAEQTANESRLDQVASRGALVMPFDLAQTTHIFSKTPQGGIQQVIVKDKANQPQIRLIRKHLSQIAQAFAQGDFSSPAKIHGETMPGLDSLRKANSEQLQIHFQDLPNGGQITYISKDPQLINALHQWFDAQLSDHARHAQSGHNSHRSHHE